jgi:AcrR family transcriptional regulator
MDQRAMTPREEEGTRERLKREALKLLATQGFNAVSLRRIVQASGAANPSALHYHFGDRSTLIREITEWLQTWLEPRACEQLGQLETRSSATYSVRDVLLALYGPVIEMLQEPGLGVDAVRFIARLGWDFGQEGQELSAQLHRRSQEMAFTLLHRLMPDLDPDTLKFRMVTIMNAVYNGIAYRSYLRHSPFGPLDVSRREYLPKLTTVFFDFLEAGVRGIEKE